MSTDGCARLKRANTPGSQLSPKSCGTPNRTEPPTQTLRRLAETAEIHRDGQRPQHIDVKISQLH
jgi:hypothetical protein